MNGPGAGGSLCASQWEVGPRFARPRHRCKTTSRCCRDLILSISSFPPARVDWPLSRRRRCHHHHHLVHRRRESIPISLPFPTGMHLVQCGGALGRTREHKPKRTEPHARSSTRCNLLPSCCAAPLPAPQKHFHTAGSASSASGQLKGGRRILNA